MKLRSTDCRSRRSRIEQPSAFIDRAEEVGVAQPADHDEVNRPAQQRFEALLQFRETLEHGPKSASCV